MSSLEQSKNLVPDTSPVIVPVEISFLNDLSGKPAGDFDVLTWNLYQALIRLNTSSGLKGDKAWRQAHHDARDLRTKLAATMISTASGEEVGFSLLQSLSALARGRKIGLLRITSALNVEFVEKKTGKVLESFNLHTLEKAKVSQAATAERKGLLSDVFGNISSAPQRIYEFFDSFGSFQPVDPPKISESCPEKTISVVDTLRLTRTAPKIIEDQFRHLDVCSAYAISVLQQAYGRNAVMESGLARHGKLANAWDITETGVRHDSLQKHATLLPLLEQVLPKSAKHNFSWKIVDKKAYSNALSSFFDAADNEHYPALITAFQTNTKYADQIWKANEKRSDSMKSYNSHVIVALGRENPQVVVVSKSSSLSGFLNSTLGVKPPFQQYLKIQIRRADGSQEEISGDWKNIQLKKGDEVSYQDVIVTDFYKGAERVMGLARFASDEHVILMDYMTLKNAQPREHEEYRPVGYFQLDSGLLLADHMKTRLNLSDHDVPYYLAAFADMGIDLNGVRPKDLLPVFDLAELRKIVDEKGGPARLRQNILRSNMSLYQEEHPDAVLIEIDEGRMPWEILSSTFEPFFQRNCVLSQREKSFIVQAVDRTCPNIDLDSPKPRFEAGDFLYLPQSRLQEIVRFVKEGQHELFTSQDFVKIITGPQDSPYSFLKEVFDAHSVSRGRNILYESLDTLEKEYLFKALAACNAKNPDVDLTLVDAGDTPPSGDFVWKKFPIGGRIIFRKADLEACIDDIFQKRDLQKTNENFAGPSYEFASGVQLDTRTLKIPADVRTSIDSVYEGNSLEDVFVRNSLYFVYAKERLGGDWRDLKKEYARDWADTYAVYGLDSLKPRSIGLFQLRPTEVDMKLCQSLFEKNSLPMPNDFSTFRGIVEQNDLAATIVAGERMRESFRLFQSFMKGNKEDISRTGFDQNFAVALLTSYNRSTTSVFRAVFQNWAYNLAEASGVSSDVALNEIDKSGGPEVSQDLEAHVLSTFKKVAEKLVADGSIHFSGDTDTELSQIFSNRSVFLNSPLFLAIKDWYESSSGKKLSFIFTESELSRGDHIFSYGQRYLEGAVAGDSDHFWGASFRDHTQLKETIAHMEAPYELHQFQKEPVPSGEFPSEVASEKSFDLYDAIGLRDCFEGGENLVTVYETELNLRQSPLSTSLSRLYFGTRLQVLDVKEASGEQWLHVKVLSGPSKDQQGFVAFDKDWFMNDERVPKISESFSEKLASLESDADHPLPADYRKNLEQYIRFIHNFNPGEASRSMKLMEKTRLTAYEVRDSSMVQKVALIARSQGYTDQKFFGILLKNYSGDLPGQRFYIIDSDNGRIVSFTISTGRPDEKHDTPSGSYTAYSQGFKDMNFFGSHMGSYAQKYRGQPKLRTLEAGPDSGNISMTTALIEVRGGENASQMNSGAGRYIHGTNRENKLGEKASSGCIRMANLDAVYLGALLNGEQMEFHILDSPDPKIIYPNTSPVSDFALRSSVR